MSIEDRNRLDIVNEIKRHFPDHEVVDEEEGSSETLNVYVNSQNGRRVCTLSFTWREWHGFHEHPAIVLAKIKKAASS
jgi:hypothetical protein